MHGTISFEQDQQRLKYDLNCDYNNYDDIAADSDRTKCITRPNSSSRSYKKYLTFSTILDILNIPYTDDKLYVFKKESSVVGVITNSKSEVNNDQNHIFFGALTKNSLQLKGIVIGTSVNGFGVFIARKIPKDLQIPAFKEY